MYEIVFLEAHKIEGMLWPASDNTDTELAG